MIFDKPATKITYETELERLAKELVNLPDWALLVQGAEIIAKIRLLMTEHYK